MHKVRTVVSTRSKLSSAAGVLQIPPEPHRCAILLGTPGSRTTLVQVGATDGSANGVPISPNVGYLLLTAADVGDAVCEAIVLTDSGAAQQTYTWVEWLYAP